MSTRQPSYYRDQLNLILQEQAVPATKPSRAALVQRQFDELLRKAGVGKLQFPIMPTITVDTSYGNSLCLTWPAAGHPWNNIPMDDLHVSYRAEEQSWRLLPHAVDTVDYVSDDDVDADTSPLSVLSWVPTVTGGPLGITRCSSLGFNGDDNPWYEFTSKPQSILTILATLIDDPESFEVLKKVYGTSA